MSEAIEEFPIFYDEQFTDIDEYSFEAEGIAIDLYRLMFWEDDFDTLEDFCAWILLQPNSDLRVESAEFSVAGAIPEKNKVIVNIRGQFF